MKDESQSAGIRTIPRIHIVGRKNAGKTTLVCDLVRELSDRGLRIATIKHTHHHHELDTPGKDSHQHRESGAAGVGILSPKVTAAFVPVNEDEHDERYATFNIMFQHCDIILVEGNLNSAATKIEVWRAALKERPYAESDSSICCVVSDDEVRGVKQLSRSDLSCVANEVEAIASS